MRRDALTILLIVLAVIGAGYALSTPVWHCETVRSPGGVGVVNRDCTHIPRSRALWNWATGQARP